MRPSLLPSCLALVACSDAASTLMADAGPPDSDGRDATVAADTSVDARSTCNVFGALGELSVSEGGRLVLARDGALADPTITFTAERGSIIIEDARILVYSDYGSSEAPLIRATCANGASDQRAITLRRLAWSRVAEWAAPDAGPNGREYGGAWVRETAPRGLFIFGGFHYVPRQFTPSSDMWFFDFATSAWTELATVDAPLAPGGRVARGPTEDTMFYFGGTRSSGGGIDTTPLLRQVRVEGNQATWTSAPFERSAPGSYTGAFVYDERRHRWLSVCGLDTSLSTLTCRVRAYSPETGFSRITPSGSAPAGRFGFAYAYDAETDRVIVAAGSDGPENEDIAGDTWALELGEEPPRWVQLVEERSDVRRRNCAFVVDPVGRRLLLWGGTDDGATSKPGIYALGLDRGRETWTRVDIRAEPPHRTSGFGVYDGAGRRALFGFGNDDDVFTDLQALAL